MFTVESNVPMPTTTLRGSKYPVEKLQPGDSFFVPAKKASPVSVYSCCKRIATRNNFTISMRKLTESGVEGCRIWRIS